MVSKLDYYCYTESSFFILSDDLTIIGVEYNKIKKKFILNNKIIRKEKMNNQINSMMTYYGNTITVYTILVNELSLIHI